MSMGKTFKQNLTDTVGRELERQGYALAPTLGYLLYRRVGERRIDLVQFLKDKYEPSIEVAVATVFPGDPVLSNIDYRSLNTFSEGKIEKITVDDCIRKTFLKGHFGHKFYYEDVYLALGSGIVGVKSGGKKPIGIRLKRGGPATYSEVCELIKKRLFQAMTINQVPVK